MDILVTKWIALSGTAWLAENKREELRSRFSESFLQRTDAFAAWAAENEEEAAAKDFPGTAAVSEIGKGGIFAALWNVAESLHTGIRADLRKIPVRQETIEICEFFNLHPYMLESFGAWLIVTENGSALLENLAEKGIHAVRIGRCTPGNDRVLLNEDRVIFITKPQPDEISKVKTGIKQ